MATNYDAIDLIFQFNGDYSPSGDGDFLDTASDQVQSIIQEIQTISNSDLGDWSENPNYAGSLNDFIGYPNNRDTSQQIVSRLRSALVNNGIVQTSDLAIQVVPVNKTKLLLIVSVQVASTPNNSLSQNGPLVITFVYDYLERGVSFVNTSGGS